MALLWQAACQAVIQTRCHLAWGAPTGCRCMHVRACPLPTLLSHATPWLPQIKAAVFTEFNAAGPTVAGTFNKASGAVQGMGGSPSTAGCHARPLPAPRLLATE